MHFSYTRYIENQIQETFGFKGRPSGLSSRERKEKINNGTCYLFTHLSYVFGLFQTAYFYGKAKGIDIRKYGSVAMPVPPML